ncbi:unnamed protein product [Mytilus coruscus]|uniref:Integrase zinc-binding domain-containing protein n=1 Tax=Mytilus coruscus TaxID=42192 RepID=A0A6J8ES90_MYTCO|nr:unnamed protein product [Mytilus coruscus]
MTGIETNRIDDKNPSDPHGISQIIDISMYSNLHKLLSVTGYVWRSQDAHLRYLHAGVRQTITQIRQSYWIPAIQKCANSVLLKCIQCLKIIGKPYKRPEPPPLPKDRTTLQNVGLTNIVPDYVNIIEPRENIIQVNIVNVVQLESESPRLFWRLGIKEDVIKGGDGLIRAAKVWTSRGLVNTRPVVK